MEPSLRDLGDGGCEGDCGEEEVLRDSKYAPKSLDSWNTVVRLTWST